MSPSDHNNGSTRTAERSPPMGGSTKPSRQQLRPEQQQQSVSESSSSHLLSSSPFSSTSNKKKKLSIKHPKKHHPKKNGEEGEGQNDKNSKNAAASYSYETTRTVMLREYPELFDAEMSDLLYCGVVVTNNNNNNGNNNDENHRTARRRRPQPREEETTTTKTTATIAAGREGGGGSSNSAGRRAAAAGKRKNFIKHGKRKRRGRNNNGTDDGHNNATTLVPDSYDPQIMRSFMAQQFSSCMNEALSEYVFCGTCSGTGNDVVVAAAEEEKKNDEDTTAAVAIATAAASGTLGKRSKRQEIELVEISRTRTAAAKTTSAPPPPPAPESSGQVKVTAPSSFAGEQPPLEKEEASAAVLLAAAKDDRPNDDDDALVRSSFLVEGMCCATEVPAVRRIVRTVLKQQKQTQQPANNDGNDGVVVLAKHIQINIACRRVYVDHSAAHVSARQIATALERGGFPARILQNGNNGGSKPQKQLRPQRRRPRSSSSKTSKSKTKERSGGESLRRRRKGGWLAGIMGGSYAAVITTSPSMDDGDENDDSQEEGAFPYEVEGRRQIMVNGHSGRPRPNHHLHQQEQQQKGMSTTPGPEEAQLGDHHRGNHNDDDYFLAEEYDDTGDSMEEEEDGDDYDAVAADWDDSTQRLHWNVIVSGVFWFLSMVGLLLGGDGHSEGDGHEDVVHFFFGCLRFSGLVSVFFGLPPVAIKAYRAVRHRCAVDANCMMVIAATGAVALGEWEEASSVSFLFALSEWLEARASSKARAALTRICQLRPVHAAVIDPDTHQVTQVAAEDVAVGSLLQVKTGDKIAADGVVVKGNSAVDASNLTGESLPVPVAPNSAVSAGTINVGHSLLLVRTTETVEDSAVSRLIRLVEEAAANTSPTETIIDRFAKRYTPIVLGVAAAMCTIPWLVSESGRYWTMQGLILVVIACPCALTISTPVTYAAGLAATAQRGIIVKGGACLEDLGRVRTVILDKTGTITEGKFTVRHLQQIIPPPSTGNNNGTTRTMSRKEMLALLAAMEAPSSHPLAATLVEAARQEGVSLGANDGQEPSLDVQDHTILNGEGVTALVNGKRTYVGNQRLMERLGMYQQLPTNILYMLEEEWETELCGAGTIGFLAIEDRGIVAAYCMTDVVRSEAKRVVLRQMIQQRRIRVMMLTGDRDGPAKAVARQVGLDESEVYSQLLPQDKLHHVTAARQELRQQRLRRRQQQQQQHDGDEQDESDLDGTNGGIGGTGSIAALPKQWLCRLLFSSKTLLPGTVLFCGDGVNDAAALTAADVGVSMGEGVAAPVAMETSDVTLMDSDLRKLEFCLHMGDRVLTTIRQNIAVSLALKVLVVFLTLLGYMTLLAAIASDVGVMLLVTLNGMKLIPGATNAAAPGDVHHNDNDNKQQQQQQGRRQRWTGRNKTYNQLSTASAAADSCTIAAAADAADGDNYESDEEEQGEIGHFV